MRTNRARSRGYSLTEILVVVALVGLFSLLAVPSYMNYMQQGRLKAAARQMSGDLRSIRLWAITQNLRVRVELESDNATYTFYSSADNGTTWTAFIPPGQTGNSKKLESPVTGATTFVDVDSPANSKPDIVFLPSGLLDPACMPSGGASPTLTLSVPWNNVRQNILTITVSRAGNMNVVGSHS